MDAKSAITGSIPVTYDVLTEQYNMYRSPKDKIARLAANGELVRLKKGLFYPLEMKRADAVSLELAANYIRWPSYVSLETALAFYGMIPERVFTTRSMTVKRSKAYVTPIGRFEYFTAKHEYFQVGIKTVSAYGVSFLIASPEKAICDMIAVTSGLRIQSGKAMREYIEEDMRIDISVLDSLDLTVFDSVVKTGVKKREISFLKEYCKNAE